MTQLLSFTIILLINVSLFCCEKSDVIDIREHIESQGLLYKNSEISLLLNEKKVGFAYVLEAPCQAYIIHSLYVHPEWRSRGYATRILEHITHKLKPHANIILIQPGPFESENGHFKNIEDPELRKNKVKQLISLYQRSGFRCSPWYVSRIAAITYIIGGIQEDAHYLMQIP